METKRIVDINTYWAEIIRDTAQFGQIAVAENPEFNRLADCIFRALEDSFIHSATEYGVKRWESMLQIAPSSGETLEERKARILTYLNLKLPYTWRVLKQLIEGIVGEGNVELNLDNDTQTLTVYFNENVDNSISDTIDALISRVVPMNLVVKCDYYLPVEYIPCDFLESNADSLVWFAAPTPAKSAEIELDLQYTQTRASKQATCGIAGHTGNWVYVDANDTRYSAVTGTNVLERSVLLFKWEATPDGTWEGKTSLSVQGKTSTSWGRYTTEATGIAMLNYDNGAWRPYYSYARVWRVRAKIGDWEVKGMPCLNAEGVPVMYDANSKTDYPPTKGNNFIAGFTLTQARKLGKLPAPGGTLTISLPSNWQEDEGVVNALATAEANGWELTYLTYEADASTASTFALRRIFVRKTQDENGQYVAADGSRWYVEWCAGMIGAEPTDHGYEPFRSVDAAVAYWELEPWIDPEELLIEEGIEQ